MKFIASLTSLFVLAASSLASTTVSVSFDNTYDNSAGSLSNVACSDGAHGLLTKGFKTFGSLPKFPNIGGAQVIAGFNSPNCGTCWALTFEGTTVNVLAIDHTITGFNIAQKAMDTLTHGQAVFLGRINATATQVAASVCGLK